MQRRLGLSVVSVVVGGILIAAAACDSVPDIRFGDADAGRPDVGPGTEADAGKDADPDALATCVPEFACCFNAPCVGDHCTTQKDSCQACPRLGCRQGKVCCAPRPQADQVYCTEPTNCL
jgi:hypothetical protein